jgi:hypothetical protein
VGQAARIPRLSSQTRTAAEINFLIRGGNSTGSDSTFKSFHRPFGKDRTKAIHFLSVPGPFRFEAIGCFLFFGAFISSGYYQYSCPLDWSFRSAPELLIGGQSLTYCRFVNHVTFAALLWHPFIAIWASSCGMRAPYSCAALSKPSVQAKIGQEVSCRPELSNVPDKAITSDWCCCRLQSAATCAANWLWSELVMKIQEGFSE